MASGARVGGGVKVGGWTQSCGGRPDLGHDFFGRLISSYGITALLNGASGSTDLPH